MIGAVQERVLILAPTRKDAALAESVLGNAGIGAHCTLDLAELGAALDAGAAALLVAEEVVLSDQSDQLVGWLRRQPAWSDLPVLLLARPGADSAAVARAIDRLGNVTVLERPEGARRSLPGIDLRSVTVAAYKRRHLRRERQHDAAVPCAS